MEKEQEQQLKAVNDLLEFSSVKSLQKSLRVMFQTYLLDSDNVMPANFKDVVEDQYFLMEFLQELEQAEKVS